MRAERSLAGDADRRLTVAPSRTSSERIPAILDKLHVGNGLARGRVSRLQE
jgi:hypothetical protein